MNNADEEKTYDCEFRFGPGYLGINLKGQDLFENVREEGIGLKTVTLIGLKGILPAPLLTNIVFFIISLEVILN